VDSIITKIDVLSILEKKDHFTKRNLSTKIYKKTTYKATFFQKVQSKDFEKGLRFKFDQAFSIFLEFMFSHVPRL